MTLPVEVLHCMICDYAAMQSDGKYTFSGVYTEDINFAGAGDLGPLSFFICILVRPLSPSGTLMIGLTTPEDAKARTVEFDSDASDAVSERDRFVLFTPVALDKPALGKHQILIGTSAEDMHPVHTFYVTQQGSAPDLNSAPAPAQTP
ncbi:hypothetical protein NO932_06460 [Pelagibacterium sp. 26DY04]|uniref:hypothetical protein n=1 Tax=Pelagibacterium sp. 26DY04 TaxID=2967130 RepID=UPI0028161000|nr:hypothetical protein [Pelagibacterium sp. 26DY04]WMT88247.1 hypothetical protein NO932_06460 [Pelagibacterium sp. 26DY04]